MLSITFFQTSFVSFDVYRSDRQAAFITKTFANISRLQRQLHTKSINQTTDDEQVVMFRRSVAHGLIGQTSK